MLELELLRLADAYDWLGTGNAAAEYLHCSQPTISRGMYKFKGLESELSDFDCTDLLEQERVIHQKWRFAKGEDLRLHTYLWSNRLIHSALPDGWGTNPPSVSSTSKGIVELVVTRRIDAACAPYPLITNADRTLIECIPIYNSRLQLFAEAGSSLGAERNLSESDIRAATTLKSLSFVPQEACRCSAEIDALLFGSERSGSAYPRQKGRYWGMALTTLVAPNLKEIDFASPCPYEEFLVVRKEWADHPLITQLLSSIAGGIKKVVHSSDNLQSIEIIS